MSIPDLGPWADLEAFRFFFLCVMVRHAQNAQPIQYETLEEELYVRSNFRRNPQHRNFYFSELDRLNSSEVAAGRFPLSVLVIKKNLGRPGDGFYNSIYKLGLIDEDPELLSEKRKKEIFGFWLSSAAEYWNRHPFVHLSERGLQLADEA